MIVVLLPDGGRGYLSKIFNDEWMADYGFLASETAEPTGRRRARAQAGASCPQFVHAHPDETVRAAIDILREYNVSQLPVMKEEPPVMAAEVVGSIVERDLLDALFAGRARPQDPLASTCRRRCRWSARASRSARRWPRMEKAGRRGGAGRRQAGRNDHPAGCADVPGGSRADRVGVRRSAEPCECTA